MIKKISIIGSGGVGSNLAFNILGNISVSELVLLDVKLDLAKATACDLEDTRGVLDFPTQIKATKNYSLIKGSDIIIFSAGAKRRGQMTRLDLLRVNAPIAKAAAKSIKKYSPKSIVIVITNPLDLITHLILRETGFLRRQVIGMGSSLDTSRLLNILTKETGVAASHFQAMVFGPHSKDMLISLGNDNYFGEKNNQVIKKTAAQVKSRGAKIVKLFKDKSAVFGPSLACCKLIEAIAYDKNQIIPVSVLLKGEYQIKGVCLGVPCLINKKGAAKVIEKKITSSQKNKLKKISSSLREILASF